MTGLVLTPFTASEAVELGNRTWRKKVLPVGDVEYKGTTLHFTRDYLGRLVRSFNDRAYDQVPFQLADAANTHTNDPERTRGEITSMELGDDGLWITAQVTPEGEAVLAANPKLGVSARIVEDYARSDGRHFPQAIQHVLGTLDPRIPGLGGWQAIEAASPVPDQVLDLSGESFTDLTGPGGWSHGWQKTGAGSTVVSGKEMHKPAGWMSKGAGSMGAGEAADQMSKNIGRHAFNDGAGGRTAKQAHSAAAKAHRAAARTAGSQAAFEHHTHMAKVHSAVASGRMTYPEAARKADLAGDMTDALEGTGDMADLSHLNAGQKARLATLLDLPDDTLDALAAGGTVLTPEELVALTDPGDEPEAGEGDSDGEEDGLAEEIDAMSDEELAALEAEFQAAASPAATSATPDFTPNYMPEGEPVGAGLSAEAQFSIDLANARADETARELAVVTARLREEDFLAEKRRMADRGVPPYITELARPLLEGAARAVELANGKTVDAGAIMRRVLTEYSSQARLLDLDVELGSPMDEPEEAVAGQQAQSREELKARFKSMTGLK